jgi:hypothetical protein
MYIRHILTGHLSHLAVELLADTHLVRGQLEVRSLCCAWRCAATTVHDAQLGDAVAVPGADSLAMGRACRLYLPAGARLALQPIVASSRAPRGGSTAGAAL